MNNKQISTEVVKHNAIDLVESFNDMMIEYTKLCLAVISVTQNSKDDDLSLLDTAFKDFEYDMGKTHKKMKVFLHSLQELIE